MDGPQGWKSYLACLAQARQCVAPSKLTANYISARNASKADMVRLWRAGKLPIRKDFVERYGFTNSDNAAMLSNFDGVELANRIMALDNIGVNIEKTTKTMQKNRNLHKDDLDETKHVLYKKCDDENIELTEHQKEVNKALLEYDHWEVNKKARLKAREKGTVITNDNMSKEECEYYNLIGNESKKKVGIPEGTTKKFNFDPHTRIV